MPRKNNAPKNWDDVRPGDPMRSVKGLLPVTGRSPHQRIHAKNMDEAVVRVVQMLVEWGTVVDPRAKHVRLDTPDFPEPKTLENRARHLLGDDTRAAKTDAAELRTQLSQAKLSSVHLIAETIQRPQMIGAAGSRGVDFYFRRYSEFRHVVLVDAETGLITQWPLDSANTFDGVAVTWRTPLTPAIRPVPDEQKTPPV